MLGDAYGWRLRVQSMVSSGLDSEWCRMLKSFLQGFAMPGLSTGQVEAQRRTC